MSDKPKHGEERDRGREYEYETIEFEGANRNMYRLNYVAKEESVSERYCDNCKKWVKCRGIIGALLCPECSTTWQ